MAARPLLPGAVLHLVCAPPAQAPAPAEKRAAVDHLLDALKAAPDEQAAAGLEGQLEQTWLRAGSPAVTLLMSRGLRSLQAGQNDEAVESFSDAITLQPDVGEAWHQRALARYHAGDVNGAIHDLEETVRLEPRDFSRSAPWPRSPPRARTGRAPMPLGRRSWNSIRRRRAGRSACGC